MIDPSDRTILWTQVDSPLIWWAPAPLTHPFANASDNHIFFVAESFGVDKDALDPMSI